MGNGSSICILAAAVALAGCGGEDPATKDQVGSLDSELSVLQNRIDALEAQLATLVQQRMDDSGAMARMLGDQGQRLQVLEAASQEQRSYLGDLQLAAINHVGRLETLEATADKTAEWAQGTTASLSRLDRELGAASTALVEHAQLVGEHALRLVTVEGAAASQGVRIAVAESRIVDQSTVLARVEDRVGTHGAQLGALQDRSTTHQGRLEDLDERLVTTRTEHHGRLTTLEAASSSQASRLTSSESRLGTLEGVTSSHTTSLTGLETARSTHAGQIAVLQTSSTAQGTRLTDIENVAAAHDNQLTTLESRATTQSGQIVSLQTITADQGTQLTVIEGTATRQGTQIGALETTTGTLQTASATHAGQISALEQAPKPKRTHLVVATCDSGVTTDQVDFLGDCDNDQEQINQAIAALPPGGGSVMLLQGTYDIRRIDERTAIRIARDNVTLTGKGDSTRLMLADNQNVNVILIDGDVGGITIRDLYINGNRVNNNAERPNVQPTHFDGCGVRAYPGGHDITIENTTIEESHALNVYLVGRNVRINNNRLGNANYDVAEIIRGPGEIRGNQVTITGLVGHGLGTDEANDVQITDNNVIIEDTGSVSVAVFRTWHGSYRNVLANNIVTLRGRGYAENMFWTRGYMNVIQGNIGFAPRFDLKNTITGSATVISGNFFQGVRTIIDDPVGWPTRMTENILLNSPIEVRRGNVTSEPNSVFTR